MGIWLIAADFKASQELGERPSKGRRGRCLVAAPPGLRYCSSVPSDDDAELARLREDERREKNWKRWGPYLSERQWGTVREDYSAGGECWDSFPHDAARSRAYRWGEDGLLGITDRQCRLCFSVALWNGRDPILKERLFGLTNGQGNHGEDVKEAYYYLDSTPTHSYLKALYKYPQAAFPYQQLLDENARRGPTQPEYELFDTGVFEGNRYFDVFAEYAKDAPDDILVRLTIHNRGPERASLHVLPTLWFRNTWSWGRAGEGYWTKPRIEGLGPQFLRAVHPSLGSFLLNAEALPRNVLFTENETNTGSPAGHNGRRHFKDAFHAYVCDDDGAAVSPRPVGTKAALHYLVDLAPGAKQVLNLRLCEGESRTVPSFGKGLESTFSVRQAEADRFYAQRIPASLPPESRAVSRQAYAGLLWTKQYYGYVVHDWLQGDPASPPPPAERLRGRNHDWKHLYARNVISMPDAWEYPWFAAWDLAFHMLPFVRIDPHFAKRQLMLLLREWYMHPSGALPAYEFAFSDVNPPVHAWACFRVYKIAAPRGTRDVQFLASVFQKLLLNFTWWVNRKDAEGNNLFSGGFLGLDNIGVFDRSDKLAKGHLEQADGTAWMGFYCVVMLAMALELADHDSSYEDMASKFFEHFVAISDAINRQEGHGLWDEEDGFYYDALHLGGPLEPLRLRSIVGMVPILCVTVLEPEMVDKMPGFAHRLRWFLQNRPDLASTLEEQTGPKGSRLLLAIASKEKLLRILSRLFDENEFLSPHGIRSLSAAYRDEPFRCAIDGQVRTVAYQPGESSDRTFGGNSNWRGPIWMPLNYLLIEALERYHHFYGDELQVEYPTGSGRKLTLAAIAADLNRRLASLFLPDARGQRPLHGTETRYRDDPFFRELVLFYEYFHGDDGKGLGASHQTGWTALITRLMENLAR